MVISLKTMLIPTFRGGRVNITSMYIKNIDNLEAVINFWEKHKVR